MKHRINKKILLNIIAILISSVFLFPLYWIIVNSLKSNSEIFKSPPTFIPVVFTFQAYIEQIAGDYSIFRGLLNSIIISGSCLILSMFLAVPAAYGLSRFRLKGQSFFILSFLVTQMLPTTMLLTPLFLTFKQLQLLDLFWAPIFANATIAIPFVVIILRSYFKELPAELEEASRIDGCSSVGTFARIMLPVAQTGLVTAGVFSFLFGWNDLIYSLTFLSSQKIRPLTAGIFNFIGKYGIQWNYIMAFSTLIIIPVISIFIVLQRYIISGLTAGAVKE